MSSPHLVAHRGHPARFSENSIAGLQSAADAGARFVEIDLQCSADGTLWLFHDPGLLRLTGRPGSIESTTDERLAELRLLAPPGGRAEPLARLADFAEWLITAPAGLFAFVEVKPEVVARLGPAAALEVVRKDLGSVESRCAVISFALSLLAEVRRTCELPIAPILENWDQLQSGELTGLEPESVFVNTKHVPPGQLPQATWDWIVYETVDPRVAADFLQRGARLVETFDYPMMSAVLESEA
jgi:glycerophosphoryl diester phosphodiesterase